MPKERDENLHKADQEASKRAEAWLDDPQTPSRSPGIGPKRRDRISS